MANLSRALLAVGEGLQGMANRQYDREKERVLAMREENMARLRSQLDDQKLEKQQGFLTAENEKERSARKEETAAERTARQAENEQDRKMRLSEGEADRELRRREGAADRELTSRRLDREDRTTSDASYLRQINQIDERLQQLSDLKTKPALEGNAGMADPQALASVDQEMAQLQKQKRQLAQERDLSLARTGDKRYQPISAEEAARLSQSTPDVAAARPQARPGTSIKKPNVAAQAPQPQAAPGPQPPGAPPMEPAMAQRLNRQVVPPGATAGNPAVVPELGRPQQARGPTNTVVDQFFQEGAARSSSFEADTQTARAVLQAIKAGQQPTPEQLLAVQLMSPQRRAALGLQNVKTPGP